MLVAAIIVRWIVFRARCKVVQRSVANTTALKVIITFQIHTYLGKKKSAVLECISVGEKTLCVATNLVQIPKRNIKN